MAEETTESPTLEEGETEVKAEQSEASADVEALMAELEKADIRTSEDLTNKLAVTKEYGQMANLLGTIRKENEELKEMIQSGTIRNVDEGYIDETSGTVDLKREVKGAVKELWDEQSKLQQEAQRVSLQRYQKVVNHKHYGRVKNVYEEKLRDPNVMIQINAGQVTHEDLFHDTLNEYWEGIARKSLETIKTLKGDVTGTETPVHVETGTEIPGKSPGVEEQSEEQLVTYRDRVDKGEVLTEEEEIDALIRVMNR